jgi:hypothetical protein
MFVELLIFKDVIRCIKKWEFRWGGNATSRRLGNELVDWPNILIALSSTLYS